MSAVLGNDLNAIGVTRNSLMILNWGHMSSRRMSRNWRLGLINCNANKHRSTGSVISDLDKPEGRNGSTNNNILRS